MSEHIHQWSIWSLVGEPDDMRHRICTVCNLEETYTKAKRVEYTNVEVAALQQLEQQLAQAREENAALDQHRWQMNDEIIRAVDAYIDEEIKCRTLTQENAAMRALLERVADFDSYDDFSIMPLQEEIDAFLAQHKEPEL